MVPEDVSHLCVCRTCHIWSLRSWNQHHHWIHIEKWFLKMYHTCVCQTCHIWSLWSQNQHHRWIHIKKWFPKMYHTSVFAGLAIYGHSDDETDITIEFTSKNGSQRWWGLHGDSTGTPQDFEGIIRTFEQVMQSPWRVHEESMGMCGGL